MDLNDFKTEREITKQLTIISVKIQNNAINDVKHISGVSYN